MEKNQASAFGPGAYEGPQFTPPVQTRQGN